MDLNCAAPVAVLLGLLILVAAPVGAVMCVASWIVVRNLLQGKDPFS